jgi:hypothetical protein
MGHWLAARKIVRHDILLNTRCIAGNVAMSAGGLVVELPLTTPPYDSTKILKPLIANLSQRWSGNAVILDQSFR